jgi:S1-C subfamily serine protease
MFASGETEGLKFSSDIVDIKIKTSDGDEIPADVVLRDKDLDLAFIKPKKAPMTPMKFVDFSQAAEPILMDELVILSRLGTVANRSLSVNLERVQSVVTKPRTFYVVKGIKSGGPAFSLNGKPVGALVMRASASGRSESMFPSMDDVLIVVLPCSTVNKIAQQAKNAQPEKSAAKETPAKQPAKPPVKNPAKVK